MGIGYRKIAIPFYNTPSACGEELHLMDYCYFIISDSGGVQDEAPFLGEPIIVTRDTTERPEALAAATVKPVGTRKDNIMLESEKLLNDSESYKRMSKVQNPFGDGHAGERMISSLDQFFSVANHT
jgi:UDP-N-acetylglucosamine 2-epimerase